MTSRPSRALTPVARVFVPAESPNATSAGSGTARRPSATAAARRRGGPVHATDSAERSSPYERASLATRSDDGGALGRGLPHAGRFAMPLDGATETVVVSLRRPQRAQRAVKRAIDVVGALLGLVLASPVLVVLAVAIKLHSRGPVMFAQSRVGRGGRRFRCYKLRTMSADAESRLNADSELRASYESNHFKLPAHADDRITSLGRLLRMTSLDEVPQFWNVLRGDMSLVGPRPVVPDEIAHYGTRRDVVLSVRPGLTGAWAVGGRSKVGYPQRASIELDYVLHWSLRADLSILARTARVVLQRRGAY